MFTFGAVYMVRNGNMFMIGVHIVRIWTESCIHVFTW